VWFWPELARPEKAAVIPQERLQMREIKHDGKRVAIFHRAGEWKAGLDFVTPNDTFIQAGTWWYSKGKALKAHVHIPNERQVPHTQEVIVIMNGQLRVDLYGEDGRVFHQEVLGAGDVGVILEAGHGYEALQDDTKVVEVKNGPFTSVEKDKRLL
jgi:hypothetical protein